LVWIPTSGLTWVRIHGDDGLNVSRRRQLPNDSEDHVDEQWFQMRQRLLLVACISRRVEGTDVVQERGAGRAAVQRRREAVYLFARVEALKRCTE